MVVALRTVEATPGVDLLSVWFQEKGAVAGVVLEGHLAQVCDNHGVKIRKKAPHINDFNEALKKADVFDLVEWRRIQSIDDVRNICDHKKRRDPTPDEVAGLVDGVDKAIKTLT